MMITNFTEYYAVTMLMAYFMFLFGILYMTRNVEQIAHHRMVEALVEKLKDNVQYNLRDIARVNYKEVDSSSEEEDNQDATSEASQEESEVESEEVESTQMACKRRRDPNPLARMLDQVD